MSEQTPFPKVKKQVQARESSGVSWLKVGLLASIGLGLAGSVVWFAREMAQENMSRSELFKTYLTGGRPEIRLLSLREWARTLQGEFNPDFAPAPEEIDKLVLDFQDPVTTTEARALIARILGFARESDSDKVLPAFVNYLMGPKEGLSVEVEVHVLLGWARLSASDEALVQQLLSRIKHPDPGLRKTVGFIFGRVLAEKQPRLFVSQIVEALRLLLADSVSDVRWNALFALAEIRDPEAERGLKDLFAQLWDRAAQNHGALNSQDEALASQALRFASTFPSMRVDVARMADSFPHIRVRSAAKNILKATAK